MATTSAECARQDLAYGLQDTERDWASDHTRIDQFVSSRVLRRTVSCGELAAIGSQQGRARGQAVLESIEWANIPDATAWNAIVVGRVSPAGTRAQTDRHADSRLSGSDAPLAGGFG
jgi:hypothetical protein